MPNFTPVSYKNAENGAVHSTGTGSNFKNERAFAVIKSDGSVVTWGWGAYGGDSSSVAGELSSGVVQVFSSEYGFAALKDDGSVVTWGYSDSSSVADKLTSGVVGIFSSESAFAALKDDGSVVTWGNVHSGIVAAELTGGVVQIFSAASAFIALKEDGSAVSWGSFSGFTSTIPNELSDDIDQIVSNVLGFAVLNGDGSVVSWGYDGDPSFYSATPDIPLDDVIQIFNTSGAFAALREDGSVVTWGRDSQGGNSSAVADDLTGDVVRLFGSDSSFVAIKADGSVITWGDTTGWGGSNYIDVTEPITDEISGDVVQMFSATNAYAALREDGSVVTWGAANYGGDSSSVAEQLSEGVVAVFSTVSAFAALKTDGSVVTWGQNVRGGDSTSVSSELSSGVAQIFSTQGAFVALKEDGSVVAWGDANTSGDPTFESTDVITGVSSDLLTDVVGAVSPVSFYGNIDNGSANEAPVAADDTISTQSGMAVTFDPLANDSDVDGDFLSISRFTNGANGTVADDQGGGLTYTPDADFTGADSFTYDVSDGNGGTDTAEVLITVQAEEVPNRPPTENLGNGELLFGLIQGQTLEDILRYELGTFFEDPDGDSLTFVATGLPDGLIVDFNTGELFGTVNDASDTYDVTMFANDGNLGGVETINFEIIVSEQPEILSAGESLQALVATTLGYETISEAKDHIQQTYSDNIKYILSFDGSLDAAAQGVGVKIEGGRSIDVADLFEVTPEGRGGTSGNLNGRITIWEDVGLEISKIWGDTSASADLFFTTYLTPINFSPIMADNRDNYSVKVGAEGALKVGSFASVTAGANLDVLSLEADATIAVSAAIGPIRATYDLVSGSSAVGLGISQTPTSTEKLLSVSAKVSLGASMTSTLTEIDRLEVDDKSTNEAVGIVTGELAWTRSSPNDGITGSGGNDNIIGTADDDIIWGMGGDDVINGGAGNDILYTGGGDGDSRNFANLRGGSGNDVLVYSGHFDWFGSGASGDDTYVIDLGWTVSDYDLSGFDPETSAPNEKIIVSELDGFAIANGGTDTIILLSDSEIIGQNIIAGTEGANDAFLLVEHEKGLLQFGTTTSKIELPGFFSENGAVENVWLATGSSSDGSLSVYNKIDLLERLAQLSDVVKGDGVCIVTFESGEFQTGEKADSFTLLSGINSLQLNSGSDFGIGGFQADNLSGGAGNDVLRGDASAFLGGSDVLDGGADNDFLMGGRGADTFIFDTNDGVDIIAAFDVADMDFSLLSGYTATATGTDFQSGVDHIQLSGFSTVDASNVMSSVTDGADGAVFSAEGTSITFYDVAANQLTADDFIFV